MTWEYWIAISFILIIAEVFSFTFYLILFAVAALGAAAVQALGFSLAWQIIVFVALSLLLTVYLRPILKKTFIIKKDHASNVDAMIGQTGLALEQITGDQGLVKVNKETWSARSSEGQVIEAGSQITVVKVEGVKLVVK